MGQTKNSHKYTHMHAFFLYMQLNMAGTLSYLSAGVGWWWISGVKGGWEEMWDGWVWGRWGVVGVGGGGRGGWGVGADEYVK